MESDAKAGHETSLTLKEEGPAGDLPPNFSTGHRLLSINIESCWVPDFVVRTEIKKIEKLKYIHRNRVRRGLVLEPEQWVWSSFRWYSLGECGPVLANEQRLAEMKLRAMQTFAGQIDEVPTL